MKKLYTFMLLMLSLQAHAETLPSLQGLGDPSFTEEPMSDPSFPAHLERMGELENAALEWQRVIYTTEDTALKTRARISLAQVFMKQKKFDRALKTLSTINAEHKPSAHMPEVLYLMSVASELNHKPKDADIYRQQLFSLFPKSDYVEKSERYMLWSRGEQGINTFPEVHTATAMALKTRLELNPAHNKAVADMVSILSLIPGLGHAYLGAWGIAIIAFILNASVLWALVEALQKRQWAYSTFFGIIAGVLYISTMFSAYHLSSEIAHNKRLETMKKWTDLIPEDFVEERSTEKNSLQFFYKNII